MNHDEINSVHRQQVIDASRLAINHAALLCEPMRQFCEDATTKEALDRPESLVKIKKMKRKLEDAGMRVELSLLLAVEKLYRLHGKRKSVIGRDFQDLLLHCWHGVAEALDRDGYAGPVTAGEQNFQEEFVLPLIQQSFETARAAEKN